MQHPDLFIAGDWGTSALRLYLCRSGDGLPEVLRTVRGPGIKDCADFEGTLFDAAAPLLQGNGSLPIALAGMVGSTIGWRECAYLTCPAGLAEMTAGVLRFGARGVEIFIAPGLQCTNIFGQPDVMRGEEVQVFGWLRMAPRADSERDLLCLPGTHAKWVSTRGPRVETFFTSMQGELYDLLLRHSLLGRTIGVGAPETIDMTAFAEGVALMVAQPTLSLQHAIFSMRSRVVLGRLDAALAASFLSGILIGADTRDALAALAPVGEPIVLIGADRLVALYAHAVEQSGGKTVCISDRTASVAGLADLLGAMPVN